MKEQLPLFAQVSSTLLAYFTAACERREAGKPLTRSVSSARSTASKNQHCPVLPHRGGFPFPLQDEGHRGLCPCLNGVPPAAATLLPGKAVAAGPVVLAMSLVWGSRSRFALSQVGSRGLAPCAALGVLGELPKHIICFFFPLAAIPPAGSHHQPKQSIWRRRAGGGGGWRCAKTPRLAPAGLLHRSRDGIGDGTGRDRRFSPVPGAGGWLRQEGSESQAGGCPRHGRGPKCLLRA